MKLASPSDCLDIEGNKSILTKWWKPEQQEETTEKERNNKKLNDVTLKLKLRISDIFLMCIENFWYNQIFQPEMTILGHKSSNIQMSNQIHF